MKERRYGVWLARLDGDGYYRKGDGNLWRADTMALANAMMEELMGKEAAEIKIEEAYAGPLPEEPLPQEHESPIHSQFRAWVGYLESKNLKFCGKSKLGVECCFCVLLQEHEGSCMLVRVHCH